MQYMKFVVIGLAVLIFFATTLLVILVIQKESERQVDQQEIIEEQIGGEYLTSYGLGRNIIVVVAEDEKKILYIYNQKLVPLAKLVIGR